VGGVEESAMSSFSSHFFVAGTVAIGLALGLLAAALYLAYWFLPHPWDVVAQVLMVAGGVSLVAGLSVVSQ
jgi:hypothetical protein